MLWWKRFCLLGRNDALAGLLLVGALWGGGWLLHWVITNVAGFVVQPLTMSGSPSEPGRWRQFGQQARLFFEQNADWMVGSALTIVSAYFLWLVGDYCWRWWQSGKTILHPSDSWEVATGLFGFVVFGTFMLTWMQTMV